MIRPESETSAPEWPQITDFNIPDGKVYDGANLSRSTMMADVKAIEIEQ